MPNKNIFIANSVIEMAGIQHENEIGILLEDLAAIYTVENGLPTRRPIGPTLPDLSALWPVGSVYVTVTEKDPADLLGFGKWECIWKEEIEKDTAHSWKRLE